MGGTHASLYELCDNVRRDEELLIEAVELAVVPCRLAVGERVKDAHVMLKKGLHSEIWGKEVCDIWEKWVVEE